MPNVKIGKQDFTYREGKSTKRTLPASWIGPVTEKVWKLIEKEKAGEKLKEEAPVSETDAAKTEKAEAAKKAEETAAANKAQGN